MYPAVINFVFGITLVTSIVSGQEDSSSDCYNSPLQKNGYCISLEECKQLQPLARKDPEALKGSNCGWEAGDRRIPKVCCPSKIVSLNTVTTIAAPESKWNAPCRTIHGKLKNGSCVPLKYCYDIVNNLHKTITLDDVEELRCEGTDIINVCCDNQKLNNRELNNINNQRQSQTEFCGKESKKILIQPKITGGESTSIYQYPWLALIKYELNSNSRCGGTLISNQHVLTAAHCVPKATHVILGDYNITNNGPDCVQVTKKLIECTEGAEEIPIRKRFVHSGYINKTTYPINDIALFKLSTEVKFTRFIKPLCLPKSDITKTPPNDLRFIATGWGFQTVTYLSDVKQHVSLPFVTYQNCKPLYKRLGNHQICAGGEPEKDTCKGDSGGPLMYKRDDVQELVGIISFGIQQCGKKPSVFVNVHHYMDWIIKHMRK